MLTHFVKYSENTDGGYVIYDIVKIELMENSCK